eukprot:PhM_4_TR3374/c0_g1_i1/m.90665
MSTQKQVQTVVSGWTKTLRNTQSPTAASDIADLTSIVEHLESTTTSNFFLPHGTALTAAMCLFIGRLHDCEAPVALRWNAVSACAATFGFRNAGLLFSAVMENAKLEWWTQTEGLDGARHIFTCAMPWVSNSPYRVSAENAIVTALRDVVSMSNIATAHHDSEEYVVAAVAWVEAIALLSRPVASDLSGTLHGLLSGVLAVRSSARIRCGVTMALAALSATLHPRLIPLHTRSLVPATPAPAATKRERDDGVEEQPTSHAQHHHHHHHHSSSLSSSNWGGDAQVSNQARPADPLAPAAVPEAKPEPAVVAAASAAAVPPPPPPPPAIVDDDDIPSIADDDDE